MRISSITLIDSGGNIRAHISGELDDGTPVRGRIVKQPNHRAYLDTKTPLTHKQKRLFQRLAVSAWQNELGDTLEGLLETERVFLGKRFHRLGVQFKAHCPVCDRTTPSEFFDEGTRIFNVCYFCGTRRKGRPLISRDEFNRINELKACKSTGGNDAEATQV